MLILHVREMRGEKERETDPFGGDEILGCQLAVAKKKHGNERMRTMELDGEVQAELGRIGLGCRMRRRGRRWR